MLGVIAFSLLCLAVACTDEDTVAREKWRTFEPRLIETTEYQPCLPRTPLAADRVVPTTDCGPPPKPELADACDDVVSTRADASRMLATRPACLDRAIRELQRYAFTDPLAPNDLAAAYYVRAQREDRPLDFFRALDAAEQAVASREPAAFFNYALVQQTLGFTEGAITAWDRFLELDSASPWAREARERRDRLQQTLKRNAGRQWERDRDALPAALQQGDRTAVARLITQFPNSAWMYFEEDVLGRWAEEPSPERLREARLYAEELSRRTQDRYALDAVAALKSGSDALREGHLRLRDGIRAGRAHKPAAELFQEAATLLKKGGSPVYLSADRRAGRVDGDTEENARRYPHFHAQVRAMRGFLHFANDQYLQSLADYEGAYQELTRLGDRESATTLLSSILGIYRILGQDDLASAAAFRGRDYASALPDPQRRNRYLGEAAALALDAGYPRVARFYQNANIRELQNDLESVALRDAQANIRHNLAIALRARAGIFAELDQFEFAMRDLRKAVEYASDPAKNAETLRALQARVAEVEARALLPRDPNAAIEAFTRAIALAGDVEYSTFRANLFVQRATARRNAGLRAEARQDLHQALALVRQEERDILENRSAGDAEAVWLAYFSRFDDAYDNLIRELIEDGRAEDAYAFAERARAYEPMNLLLNFGHVAAEFRRELGPEQILSRAQIQKHLPAGTFVVEYAVLQDRTYAWLLGRDSFAVRTLRAGRDDVRRWSEDLQDAARRRDEAAFQTGLNAPYDRLIADVLAEVRKTYKGTPRLVVIPDGAMHGIPFAALRDRTSGEYVLQRAIVSNAPSAAFYIHSLLRDRELRRTAHPSAVLYGNPAFDTRLAVARDLPRLMGAESEVRRVAEIYAPHATVRIGMDATTGDFLSHVPQGEIVHVAAHGVVNPRMPFRSALLLADSAMDAETLLKQLHAQRTRLIVLSACSSAGGLPVGAEGVSPLVRPILAAGVPGVIGTLWDVDDATSAELMVSFHRHYRLSSDAAVALQNAQAELLTRHQGTAPALTWAPFQVTGHASSPFAVPDNNRGEPP